MADGRRVLVAGVALFAVLATVASFFGTWSDEEYTLAATGSGVPYAIHRAITYELQAPLYFAILAAWRELNGSVWFARLFSLLCATGFFFTAAAIAKRIAARTDPLFFAGLVALNPFVVFDALEIRLYALALLVSALMWLTFDLGFANGTSKRARVAFVTLAICGTYVQYFLAFMLVGFGCALIAGRKWKALVAYGAGLCVFVIAIAPLAVIARSQVAGESSTSHAALLSIVYLTSLHPWLEFLYPHPYFSGALPLEHVAYAFIALSIAVCWVLSRPRLTSDVVMTLAIPVAIECVYLAVVVVLDQRLVDRYFVALFVPVATAVYALERASRARPAIPQRIVVATFATLTAISLVSTYRYLAQNGDWKRVSAYLESHARPGDLIAIYPSDSLPAFERQYAGPVRVAPFPRPNPTDRYVIGAVDVDSVETARAAFDRLAPYHTLWLVDAVRCQADHPQYGCDALQRAVDSEFRTIDNVPFYTNRIEELGRRNRSTP